MKELYRHKDHALVAYYKTVLEAEGIPIMLRNEYLAMAGLSEIPIPEFYPNICVMNDEDYPRAREILKQILDKESDRAEGSDIEVTCPKCGEKNPGNFDICYACGVDLIAPE